MNHYKNYLEEINKRKENGLNPKPIDNGELLSEIIDQIVDLNHIDRKDSLNFFIYNVIPGTTSAARVKAAFLKQIIVGDINLKEISPDFAFELLSHMKGGPSIEVLIDFISGNNLPNARSSTNVLKNQVFLYEADMDRLADLFNKGNDFAKEILESYSKAEFFTKLPEVQEEIKVVTYVAGIGDISTDFLSPGGDAHSRSDRELHGQSIFDHDKNLQKELLNLKELHPDKTVMLIAEKGTMGVGSSRMSGVNNVALWTGQKTSPYVPFVNNAPIVAGTNGISPIFLTTVDVTGGIGINLQNWIKKKDSDGNTLLDSDGEPILEEVFSVKTGTVLTINSKTKKLYNEENELCDVSSSFTPQKLEFMRAGSSYSIVFGKKLQSFAAGILGIDMPEVFAPSKEIHNENQGLTAVEKIFNKNLLGAKSKELLKVEFNAPLIELLICRFRC